ncbi:hypothetical protein [Entomospira culicis]|uniref:Uncharacterized protein n=1 Tax=Entomospira culicis TaxID=2719989 RepID=A0A968GIZ3_9SPIO|nr:hypothetical protein [Entomospira culicis]NIZ19555.1 hypothetical protein [Entomospira culicis]NIZ69540.1 hypothetical protein [Entomospira culicis]WDI36652.1 hypothetical protein PVA46_04825 [Entomospira culicis]WDI38281.1 hypothetical protein PVA47_04835 [Entomospira culicis]
MQAILSYRGQAIDKGILHQVITYTRQFQCEFDVINLDLQAESRIGIFKIALKANEDHKLKSCIQSLYSLGMDQEEESEALFKIAQKDAFAPDDFYLCQGNPIEILYNNQWHRLLHPTRLTLITWREESLSTIFLDQVRAGDYILCGYQGIRAWNMQQPKNYPSNPYLTLFSSASLRTFSLLESQAYFLSQILQKSQLNQENISVIIGHNSLSQKSLPVLETFSQRTKIHHVLTDQNSILLDLMSAFFNPKHISDAQELYLMKTLNKIHGYGSIRNAFDLGALNGGWIHQLLQQESSLIIAPSTSVAMPLPESIQDVILLRNQLTQMLAQTKVVLLLGDGSLSQLILPLLTAQHYLLYVDKHEHHSSFIDQQDPFMYNIFHEDPIKLLEAANLFLQE